MTYVDAFDLNLAGNFVGFNSTMLLYLHMHCYKNDRSIVYATK